MCQSRAEKTGSQGHSNPIAPDLQASDVSRCLGGHKKVSKHHSQAGVRTKPGRLQALRKGKVPSRPRQEAPRDPLQETANQKAVPVGQNKDSQKERGMTPCAIRYKAVALEHMGCERPLPVPSPADNTSNLAPRLTQPHVCSDLAFWLWLPAGPMSLPWGLPTGFRILHFPAALLGCHWHTHLPLHLLCAGAPGTQIQRGRPGCRCPLRQLHVLQDGREALSRQQRPRPGSRMPRLSWRREAALRTFLETFQADQSAQPPPRSPGMGTRGRACSAAARTGAEWTELHKAHWSEHWLQARLQPQRACGSRRGAIQELRLRRLQRGVAGSGW